MDETIFQALEHVGRDKDIDIALVIRAAEEAMEAAARKFYKSDEDFVAKFDKNDSGIKLYKRKIVVKTVKEPSIEITLAKAKKIDEDTTIGDILEIPVSTEELGRIAAQTAKQVIYQKVREAERDNIYEKYSTKINEVVNCIVKRIERSNVIVSLGKIEAVMLKKHQMKNESYNPGDRIKAIIVDVEAVSKGPQVLLSRAEPRLVEKLFEQEVPEIYENVVRIKKCVREPGERSKIAVQCSENDIDPVGACVGMKGYRVQNVIKELNGEKIDIIQYSEDPASFVKNALNPAKVNRINIIDREEKRMEVVVDDTQLSLAIGKNGQNVRLAAQLIDWKIDIKSEADKLREVQAEMERMQNAKLTLQKIDGVGEKVSQILLDAGYFDSIDIVKSSVENLLEIPGIGSKSAERIFESAREIAKKIRKRKKKKQRKKRKKSLEAEAKNKSNAEVTEGDKTDG